MVTRHKLLIPSNVDYSNIEFEFEGTAEQAIEEYYRLFNLFRGKKGVETKEFNDLIDEYLTTKEISNGADRYVALGTEKLFSQQDVVQIIKRSHARTKDN